MFSEEIRNLLFQVITSWQVLAVTVVLVLYFFIVNYVARVYYRRPRRLSMPKAGKTETPETSVGNPAAAPETDDLGLEEPGAPADKNA